MPASYTHTCIASNAVLKLAEKSGKIHLNAALAGAEGPDPLFYSFITKKGHRSLPAVAGAMHKTKTGRFLDVLAENAGDSNLLRSFVYGFLSHYATDTVFHPFIYTKSYDSDGKYNSDRHCKYEHSMEVYVYRRLGKMVGLPHQMSGYSKLTSKEKNDIAELLYKSILEVYPDLAPEKKEIRKSFNDAIRYGNLLRGQALSRNPLLLKIASHTKAFGLIDSHVMPNVPVTAFEGSFEASGFTWDDMTNAGHKEWRSLWESDVVRTESFDQLYGMAVDRSVEYMQAAEQLFEGKLDPDGFSKIHGDMSYDSGTDWEKTTVPPVI